jgi:hypothetical protein
MVAKKEERKKKKRGNDDRTLLIRSDLTYLTLIFCGPERTEENWHSQGSYGYIHPPLYMQSLQVTRSTPRSSGSPWDWKIHHGKKTTCSGELHSR